MIIVARSERTMRNAAPVEDDGLAPAPRYRRDRLARLSLKWIAAEKRRKQAREMSLQRVDAAIMRDGPPIVAPHRRIINEVAAKHRVSAADITGPSRKLKFIAARFEAIGRVYVECRTMSLPRIGKLFGGRDHSTIVSALRRAGIYIRGERP